MTTTQTKEFTVVGLVKTDLVKTFLFDVGYKDGYKDVYEKKTVTEYEFQLENSGEVFELKLCMHYGMCSSGWCRASWCNYTLERVGYFFKTPTHVLKKGVSSEIQITTSVSSRKFFSRRDPYAIKIVAPVSSLEDKPEGSNLVVEMEDGEYSCHLFSFSVFGDDDWYPTGFLRVREDHFEAVK